MGLDPKITVIIPVTSTGDHLDKLFSSFTQYATPDCELVAVLMNPTDQLRARVEISDFKLRVAKVTSPRWLTFAFLREYVHAPVVLFLGEHCYLDDLQTLESHLSLHEKHETAIGIGGRFRSESKHTLLDQVYDMITNDELEATRKDGLHATHLFCDHMSFKANELTKLLFRTGELELSLLPAEVACTTDAVLLVDNLTVSRDLHLTLSEFAHSAFSSGQLKRKKLESELLPQRRYYRLAVSLDEQIRSLSFLKARQVTWLRHFYDLAFQAGFVHRENAREDVASFGLLGLMLGRSVRYMRFSATSLWHSGLFTELFCMLSYVLHTRALQFNASMRQRKTQFKTIRLR